MISNNKLLLEKAPNVKQQVDLPDCSSLTTQISNSKSPTNSTQHNNERNSITSIEFESNSSAILNEQIRNKLEKLNALSDRINDLERQSDHTNKLFRETLKYSSDRLREQALSLGIKSIKRSRVYQAAKLSVEQTQNNCQEACLRYERANRDHQDARDAIKIAEDKLKKIKASSSRKPDKESQLTVENFNDLGKIETHNSLETVAGQLNSLSLENHNGDEDKTHDTIDEKNAHHYLASGTSAQDTAKVSEELNFALAKLAEANELRASCQKEHMSKTNELMIAQENLIRLEREFSVSIKKTRPYFEEAKKFNAKLDSLKLENKRLIEDVNKTKQDYSRALRDLELFSDDLRTKQKLIDDEMITNILECDSGLGSAKSDFQNENIHDHGPGNMFLENSDSID